MEKPSPSPRVPSPALPPAGKVSHGVCSAADTDSGAQGGGGGELGDMGKDGAPWESWGRGEESCVEGRETKWGASARSWLQGRHAGDHLGRKG